MPLKLSIYILVDNNASNTCNSEHGLSYVVDFDKTILFDTGQSDLFVKNADQMQVSLDAIESVVLSHGHYDHGNGLMYLKNKTLICHPDAFLTRFSGKKSRNVGLNFSREQAQELFDIKATKEPHWISDKMLFLGEIPRKFSFEKNDSRFYLADKKRDLIWDDSAMVVVMHQGLFVISGCAHSGICNIIEYAKKVTHVNKVFGVIGGFHLRSNDKQTQETLHYFKQNEIKVVMPSHCTELPALALFYQEFGGEQVKSGRLYTFDDA